MSELSDVKKLVNELIEDMEFHKDDLVEDVYNDLEDDVCVRGICGALDCNFCPLNTLESFIKEYGDIL